MEDNFELWFSGRRKRETINDIKVRLSTRCPDTQLNAVKFLELALAQDSDFFIRDVLLDEDIVGFLCDTMSTNCLPVINVEGARVLMCDRLATEVFKRWTATSRASILELLSESDKMLRDGHAVLAVETSQRCAHFLCQLITVNPQSEATLSTVLDLISTLLTRWGDVFSGSERPVSSVCQPVGLVTVLKNVLGVATVSPEIVITASSCLVVTLRILESEKLESDLENLVSSCTVLGLKVLKAILLDVGEEGLPEDEQEKGNKEVDTQRLAHRLNAAVCICKLHTYITRIRCSNETITDEGSDMFQLEEFDFPLSSAETMAFSYVMELCVPLTLSTTDDTEQMDGPLVSDSVPLLLVESLLTAINQGFSRKSLASRLAEKFLFALPVFYRSSSQCGDDAPLQLLCAILARLVPDMLPLSDWWEGDHLNLSDYLMTAASELADDDRQWPSVLSMAPFLPWNRTSGPLGAAQLLLMLLAYFKSFVGGSREEQELVVLAEHLGEYVVSLPPGRELPAVVLKVVWLPLAECLLTTSGHPDLEPAMRRASTRLVDLLLEEGQLEAAYTHHPVLVYWAFQVEVPPLVQQTVAALWLAKEKEPDFLAEIVRHTKKVTYPLLDVICRGAPVVAEAAALVLHQSGVEGLSEALWHVLPGALVRCSEDRSDGKCMAEACGQLLWLAADAAALPPPEQALRTAHALTAVLCRGRLTAQHRFLAYAMRLASKMVCVSCSVNDQRVLGTLLGDSRLPKAVVAAIKEQDALVRSAALGLLLELEKKNALLNTTTCSSVTPIPGEVLLACLSSKDVDVLKATLGLLVALFDSGSSHHVVSIDLDSICVMKAVYWRLQNLAVSIPESLASLVWIILREVLTKYSTQQSQQPWNHLLIDYTLRSPNPPGVDPNFYLFVLEWLRLNKPATPPKPEPRRAMTSLLTTTVGHIASAVLRSDEQFQDMPVIKSIVLLLPAVTADLPPEILDGINKIIQRRR